MDFYSMLVVGTIKFGLLLGGIELALNFLRRGGRIGTADAAD